MFVLLHYMVHVLLAVALPPLLLGVITRTKAIMAGRAGAPLMQPYFDLVRLFQKGTVLSRTTTWVFWAGPIVGVATTTIALLMVPLTNGIVPISFRGDLILLVYLLGLGRFFLASAALDTGSSFEGMGAAREVMFASLAEPALVLGLAVVAKLSGSLQLADMLGDSLTRGWQSHGDALSLVLLSWFIVLLAENGRIPFDDPNTHLELTMIHEVMVLDHSGPALAMILYGVALKLFLFAALVVRLARPFETGSAWLGWVVFTGGVFLVAIGIGIVESTVARLRMTHVPLLLVTACLLSAFGLLLLFR